MPVLPFQIVKLLTSDQYLLKQWRTLCRLLDLRSTDFVVLEYKFSTGIITMEDLFSEIINCWMGTTSRPTVQTLSHLLRSEKFIFAADKLDSEFSPHDQTECLTPRPKFWHNIDGPSLSFTGRGEELEKIQKFFEQSSGSSKTVLVSGPPLIGKKALVKKIASWFKEKYHGSGIWINNLSGHRLNDFLNISNLYSISELGKLHENQNWLLVFEYFESIDPILDELEQLPENQQPFIILISRNFKFLSIPCQYIELEDWVLKGGIFGHYLAFFKFTVTPWVIQQGANPEICLKIDKLWSNLTKITNLEQGNELGVLGVFHMFILMEYVIGKENIEIPTDIIPKSAKSVKFLEAFIEAGILKHQRKFLTGPYKGLIAQEQISFLNCTCAEIANTFSKYLLHPTLNSIYGTEFDQPGKLKWLFNNLKHCWIEMSWTKFALVGEHPIFDQFLLSFCIQDGLFKAYISELLTAMAMWKLEVSTYEILHATCNRLFGESDKKTMLVGRRLGQILFHKEMYIKSLQINERLYALYKEKSSSFTNDEDWKTDVTMVIECLKKLGRLSEATQLETVKNAYPVAQITTQNLTDLTDPSQIIELFRRENACVINIRIV